MTNLGTPIILKESNFSKYDKSQSYIKRPYNLGAFVDIPVFYSFIHIFLLDIFFFMRLT